MSAREIIREKVSADVVGKNKAGNFVVRRGFFYTNGKTAEDYRAQVEQQLGKVDGMRVVGCGEVWKAFRGGASTAQQSHWWVEIAVGV